MKRKLFLIITLSLFTLLFAQQAGSTIGNKQIGDINLYNYRKAAIVQFPSKILEVGSENLVLDPSTVKFMDKYLIFASKAKLSGQLFYILTEEKAYYYYISTSYNDKFPVILEIED